MWAELLSIISIAHIGPLHTSLFTVGYKLKKNFFLYLKLFTGFCTQFFNINYFFAHYFINFNGKFLMFNGTLQINFSITGKKQDCQVP